MKKLTKRRKKYNQRKSVKGIKKRQKSNKSKKYNAHLHMNYYGEYDYRIIAPRKFSLLESYEDTIAFFDKAGYTIDKCKRDQSIYFDMSSVETVTTDAIMYIIALMRNTNRLRALNISCGGNNPKDSNARSVFENTGFYSYVERMRYSPSNPPTKANIWIHQGEKAEGELVGRICDFLNEGTNNTQRDTKRLYPMIIELMTNTMQHAYLERVNKFEKNWYIYVEKDERVARFVFLDTGEGIPATIYYNFFEKLGQVFRKCDSDYIESALMGEFRTETGQNHRGKGLPDIYKDSVDGRIENMVIISGHGQCEVKKDGKVKKKEWKSKLNGTLFKWDFILGKEL